MQDKRLVMRVLLRVVPLRQSLSLPWLRYSWWYLLSSVFTYRQLSPGTIFQQVFFAFSSVFSTLVAQNQFLAHHLGEISSGIAMGFAIVLITGFAWTRELSLAFLIPALPATLLVGSIMLTNNIRDIRNDENTVVAHYQLLLGRDRAISLMSITYIFNFFWIGAWIYLKVLPIPAITRITSHHPSI